jgi:hypothetical protein
MKSLVQSWRLQCNFSIPFVKNVVFGAKKWSQVILSAAPFSGKPAPWPPNMSDGVSCMALVMQNVSLWILATPPVL